jgi:hypothetical protein
MDNLPLKRYLLGQHLEGGGAAASKAKKEGSATKAQLLSKLGGVTTLGKGFTKDAHQKFNPSQLQVIIDQ